MSADHITGSVGEFNSSHLSEADISKDRRFLFGDSVTSCDSSLLIGGWRISRLRLLSVLCFLLSAVCLVLIIWCAHTQPLTAAQSTPQTPQPSPPPPPAPTAASSSSSLSTSQPPDVARDRRRQTVCNSADCLRQAADIVSYMNRSAEPCTDFYQYACGQFDQVHPLGVPLTYSIQQVLEQHNRQRLEQLLDAKRVGREADGTGSALRKVRLLYQTCMDSFIGASTAKPILNIIKELGGWQAVDGKQSEPEKSNFFSLFEATRESHGLRLFFTISWLQRDKSIIIEHPRSEIDPDRELPDKFISKRRLSLRQKLIEETLAIIQNEADLNTSTCRDTCVASNVARDVIQFETRLASLIVNTSEEAENKTRLLLDELNEQMPVVRWPQLLNRLFGGGINLNSLIITLTNARYLTELNALLSDTNTSTLVNYIHWNLIESYLPAMGPRFAVLAQELTQVTSNEPFKARNDVCFSFLKRYMSRALQALFVIEHIGSDNVQSAVELFRRLVDQIAVNLNWMTAETRANSLEVLRNVSYDFGHAPWMIDPSALNAYYSELHVGSGSFFDNMVEANGFRATEVKNNLQLLINDSPDDDQLWVTGETGDVELGYNPIQERLIVPAGALQTPLFIGDDDRFSVAQVNIAAIGSLMLTELVKPFYIYHHTFRRKSWWDSVTESKYNRYKQCLTSSLQGYTVEARRAVPFREKDGEIPEASQDGVTAVRLNPERVLNYLQSHHLAMLLSSELFRKQFPDNDRVSLLPGFEEFTASQLFYIVFAQARCQTTHHRLQPLLYSALKQFPVAPMINNFVYNAPHFRQAFRCQSVPEEHSGQHCSLDQLV